MTRNKFNQAKHQSAITISLSASKGHQLFFEDDDDIDMRDTYKVTNVHLPIDEKDVVNKGYFDSNLLSSSDKIDIFSKNIAELRKGEFDKITTKTLQLNKTQVNDERLNDMHYDFNHENIMKEIESYFVIES